jgi:carbon monoxide dehydrogenase subunit G
MKIEGEHLFKGPREIVWEMIRDPNMLMKAIPGSQEIKEVEPNHYDAAIHLRIGPVSGSFAGTLVVSDEIPPESCTLTVDGRGAPGFAKGVGYVKFTDNGDQTTTLNYTGDVTIGGTLASVGSRMIDSVSKMMIKAGFSSLDKALEEKLKESSGK